MKDITHRIFDTIWKSACQKSDLVKATKKSKKTYKCIRQENFFQHFDSRLTEKFRLNGFERIEDEIWIKKTETLISYKIYANVWKKYLPEMVYISPLWSLSINQLASFMNRYFGKEYGAYPGVFSIWAKDAFPRTFKDSGLTIRLDEIESTEQLFVYLDELADNLLLFSDRFFQQFITIDDVKHVVEKGQFKWGDKAIINNRIEILGFLYALARIFHQAPEFESLKPKVR